MVQLFHKQDGQFRRVRLLLTLTELAERGQKQGAEVPVSYMQVSGAGKEGRPSQDFVSKPVQMMIPVGELVEMTPVTVRGFGRGGMFFEGSLDKLRDRVDVELRERTAGRPWKDVELWEDGTFRRKCQMRPDRIQIDEQPRARPLPWEETPVQSAVPTVTPVVVTEMARVVPIASARSAVAKRPRSTRSSPRPSVPPTAA